MIDRNQVETLWWSAGQAVRRLEPDAGSNLISAGFSGCLFRSHRAPLLHADFDALLIPGLRALGLSAELLPLSIKETPAASLIPNPLLFPLRREGVPVFGFEYDPETVADLAEEADIEQARAYAASVRAHRIIRQAIVFREGPGRLTLREAGEEKSLSVEIEKFYASFSHGLRLRRAETRGTRRVNMNAAVHRAVLFGLAFPERFLTTEAADGQNCTRAGEFLALAAGRQRDALSNRWRRAGEHFSAGDIATAWDILYASVLRSLNLPDAVCAALLCPPDLHLTDSERRELIYTARAGKPAAQLFAVHKLQSERHKLDARHTLEQLMNAADPLVRAAAYFEE